MVAMDTFFKKTRGLFMFFLTNSLSFGALGMGDVGERITGFLLPEGEEEVNTILITLFY